MPLVVKASFNLFDKWLTDHMVSWKGERFNSMIDMWQECKERTSSRPCYTLCPDTMANANQCSSARHCNANDGVTVSVESLIIYTSVLIVVSSLPGHKSNYTMSPSAWAVRLSDFHLSRRPLQFFVSTVHLYCLINFLPLHVTPKKMRRKKKEGRKRKNPHAHTGQKQLLLFSFCFCVFFLYSSLSLTLSFSPLTIN